MSERAQALAAIREHLRNFETVKRTMDRIGSTTTTLERYVEDVTTLLGLVEAPAVGGPQPGRASDVLGDMDSVGPLLHAPGKPLSPVEPTRCRACWDAIKARVVMVQQLDSVEPAPPTPAPCVWRAIGVDVARLSLLPEALADHPMTP